MRASFVTTRCNSRTPASQAVAAVALIAAMAGPAGAQRGRAPATPEFTKQALLITNFATEPTLDRRLSRRAADAVRSRVSKLANKREFGVIDGENVDIALEKSSYPTEGPLEMDVIRSLGTNFRGDEFLAGTARSGAGGVRVRAELVLFRDTRLRQPIAEVVAPKLDDAAELLAKGIVAARSQLVYHRRCENALRIGRNDLAVGAAREGVAAYPRSTIARTCLLWALRSFGAPAGDVLSVAREVLAIDATSVHAIESAALSLDKLGRPAESAELWLKLAQSDTADLELASRIAFTLVEGGSAKRAEAWIVGVSDAHRDHLPLLRLKWRATYQNKSWAPAVEAGEALLAVDSAARADSSFYTRLATAYRATSRPYKAIEILARAVNAFPRDSRLYSMYTQYIRAESDSVVTRGLALFPNSADLLALNARDLRTRGKLQESLEATRRAVSLDTSMAQGQLMVAQLEVELGRPDSALMTLHRAIAGGEDSALVAGFALSKGNTLYRAANGTRTSNDYTLALRYVAFADSVRPSTQSRFLVGAAALGLAQSAIAEAPKVTDKAESCRLAKLGGEMVPVARAGLQAGQEMMPEVAKTSLDFLETLDPYVTQQIAAFCSAP
jgi:tetratricopeptide (TPR) repeat protein